MTNSALQDFTNDELEQEALVTTINAFAKLCAQQAQKSGFSEDPDRIRLALQPRPNDLAWFESCELQAELARIGSEVGEAVEAVRKPAPDHHLPQFDNLVVELADVLIRIGDTAGRRNMPLGEAIVSKMLYNASRPRKHGKDS